MLTSTPEAAFGRQAASQISVVMKSGTNQLQGTAYRFFRNGALDATNYFAPKNEPAPEYQRNQFGFSLGGPIVRDRTFFFADYEGTRADEGITRVTTVPTDAARNALPAFVSRIPVGRAIAALYPSPIAPARAELRVVADPARPDRSLRRAGRHRVRRIGRSDGAVQLRRSPPVRAVQRSVVFAAAGLRKRCRAPRSEFRGQRDAHPVADAAERDASRGSIACQRACFRSRRVPSNRSVGSARAVVESARCRARASSP